MARWDSAWLLSMGGDREQSRGIWAVPICPSALAAWSALGVPGFGGAAGEGARCRQRSHPRPLAPTVVVLGRVPVSALKSAPPARACPGPGSRELG